MPVEFHLHDGAAVRKAKELHLHDGTAARKAKEVWYHDGTAARKVFSSGPINPLPGGMAGSAFTAPTDAFAAWTFRTDGTVYLRANSSQSGVGNAFSHNWHGSPGAGVGTGFWLRATKPDAGHSTPGGNSLNTWHPMTADISFTLGATVNGLTRVCDLTIEIASDSSGTPVVAASATSAYQMYVESAA